MRERWFNYRPLSLIFGFLLLGSVFSFYLSKDIIIPFITLFCLIIGLVVFSIYKKKLKYFIIPIVSFLIGVSFYNIAIYKFNDRIDYVPSKIHARIYNVSPDSNSMVRVEADSCVFDSKKVNDNIIIYVYDSTGAYDNIEIGSVIEFTPYKFYKSDLMYNKIPNSNLLSNKLKYTTSVLMEDVKYIKTDKTFAENIKDKIKENISIGLTNENSEIAFSALFGDKDLLSKKQYNVYKMSGIAHLLAVSGLHVGIIVGILQFILNFRKKRKWWKLFIIFTILLFYMYLCGYSVSIVRASIMSIIMLIATIIGREYDPFNAISISGIIIFIINPLCVFDASFLLSFSCIIGITMLYMPIEKVLNKSKFPNSIRKSLAMSISTTIGITFIMAYYFKNLNVISVFANILLIPIFSIAFSSVFVIAILSLLLPSLPMLLSPINYIFSFISIVANLFGMLPIANFSTITFNFITIIIYFVLILFAGRFCTAKYQYKLIITIPILAFLVCCLL